MAITTGSTLNDKVSIDAAFKHRFKIALQKAAGKIFADLIDSAMSEMELQTKVNYITETDRYSINLVINGEFVKSLIARQE